MFLCTLISGYEDEFCSFTDQWYVQDPSLAPWRAYHNNAILFKNNVLQSDNVEFVWTLTFYLAVMAKNKYKASGWVPQRALSGLGSQRFLGSCALWQHFLDYRKQRKHVCHMLILGSCLPRGDVLFQLRDAQKWFDKANYG